MPLLAIYPRDRLMFPDKVLTHDEDIQRHLTGLTVGLRSLAAPPVAEFEAPEAFLALLVEQHDLAVFDYAEVFHHTAPPAYAEQVDAQAQTVHRHAQPTARWLLKGGGSFCLFTAGELYYLDCAPGDLLLLPAGMPHAFLPRVGQPGSVLRLAAKVEDLTSLDSPDCSLEGFQPLD
ncbi:cupin domain-containing protein [Halopseudomonas salegens]|uniref:Acireductone dioxygenase apoprotein n=1 Tax=Halopseudomonas salegens TaxID=1434072 RepID=A0A1H2EZ96_9GAMM|nr:hypothetical protein [Halopseudomonas salegens]SDU00427.1 acireductone dioxygenase apoprotein [Halopseudomonas salegens]